MDAFSYSHTRKHLAEVIDKVNKDRTPVLVTRQNGKHVVLMSLDDYTSLEETIYLLRSPINAKRLISAIEQLTEQTGKPSEVS